MGAQDIQEVKKHGDLLHGEGAVLSACVQSDFTVLPGILFLKWESVA